MRLKDKVCIVTGGGAGIGQAICERFGQEGARVVVAEINDANGQAVAENIRRNGGQALFVHTDVSKTPDVQAVVEATVTAHGRIDVLVNNAAVQFIGQDAPPHEVSEEIWDRTFAVNIRGAWLCSKYALQVMLKQNYGCIVNIASPTGLLADAPQFSAYSTSKGGMFSLTRVIAGYYGKYNIRANAVTPGVTATPLIAKLMADPKTVPWLNAKSVFGRVGTAEEVANMALFLASDESSFCTGGFYMVDGGLTAI
jgi:NAD(P)-dependent dehydrogenase (short-subunit alcohol dehydrogenase family)